MKRNFILAVFAVALVFAAPAFSEEPVSEGPAFEVSRLVLSKEIIEREPAGVAGSFPLSVGKVYCFLEVLKVREDTGVVFVWYYRGDETARVEVPIRKSGRWRTYSSKRLGQRTGKWKVELQDRAGNIIKSVDFEVL
jgi:hypothetical protein